MSQRILLVEDDAGLALTLSDRLRSEAYQVEVVHDGEAGLSCASTQSFDLILLDWMLPKRSGIDVCRDLRQMKISTSILMLTARGQTTDKVIGLKMGADDYLTKPFDMSELLARVEALMRRSASRETGPTGVWQAGTIAVDRRRSRVTRNGTTVDLAPREYTLLCYFLDHADRTITREELLREVWSYRFIPSTRTVDVHVGALRQKLEEDPKQPKLLITVQGQGYCLGSLQ
ncbi:MAG: response regulator transcription factor [Acidobacteriaceae bacterium]